MSYGMTCGKCWGGCLGVYPGCNVMSPCGSTLGGGAGATSDVVSGVCTLGGGLTSGGSSLVNISASFLSAAVCLYHNVVSGLVGFVLKRIWVISAAVFVAASFDGIIGNVRVAGKQSVVSENLHSTILGV